MTADVTVGVEAAPSGVDDWAAFARRVEALGFSTLRVADHPGSGPAPFVALAAAAAVTERIRLGTYVVNAGAWEPMALASEAATLDVVSGGRALLGVGAGHTPAEWRMRGRPYPEPGARVDRMIELVDATQRLLGGEEVTAAGDHVTLEQARLERPRPIQRSIPLLIGGNGRRVLSYAAERADVVGLSGLGRTLPDGHRHDVRWGLAEIDRRIELVHAAAAAAGRAPRIEALVQFVELTDDAEATARRLADRVVGLRAEDALRAPFVWIGTVDEIAGRLRAHRDRWGLDRYVVRAAAVDAAHEVLTRLQR